MGLVTIVRRLAFVLVVVVVLGTFPVLHVMWRTQPTHELDILVFDVTVADTGFGEHAVLDLVLQNERVPFELGQDHVGAGAGGVPFGQWPTDQPELIVLADGYGVYADSEGQIGDQGRTLVSPALTTSQAADIERWVVNGVPAYAEFALTTEPTPVEASEYLQDAFGFDSLGWIGKASDDLSQVSPTIAALGPSPWPYSGPGMLFVTVQAGASQPPPRLVVLTEEHLDSWQPAFVGGPTEGRGDLAPFYGWFELIEPTTAAVESWLTIPVNDEGADALAHVGLPTRWPGVVSTPTTVYVAADGLEDPSGFAFRQFAFGEWMSWKFADTPDERFFHQILRPSLSRVVHLALDRTAEPNELSSPR